jgi:hypothetical protein
MKISNVDVRIPCAPFADNPFGMESVALPSHVGEGNVITFTVSSDVSWMAELMGIKITYTQEG